MFNKDSKDEYIKDWSIFSNILEDIIRYIFSNFFIWFVI